MGEKEIVILVAVILILIDALFIWFKKDPAIERYLESIKKLEEKEK